jgi:hypothetical protein
VLIKALDEGDERTLVGLVAAKAELKEIDAIYQKHGKRTTMTLEDAAKAAAAGWKLTYAFFQAGKTEVVRQVMGDDSAVVYAKGVALDGKARTLKINLLREDGVWKISGGLHSLPGEPETERVPDNDSRWTRTACFTSPSRRT